MSVDATANSKVQKRWNLYVLRLVNNKYYVGITTKTPEERMQEHLSSPSAARWCQRYKPLEVIEKQPLGLLTQAEAEAIENKKTREVMRAYGYNNVRGGDLSYWGDYVQRFWWLIADKDLEIVYSLILSALMSLPKCFIKQPKAGVAVG